MNKKRNRPNSKKPSQAQFDEIASRIEQKINNFLNKNPEMKKKIMAALNNNKEK